MENQRRDSDQSLKQKMRKIQELFFVFSVGSVLRCCEALGPALSSFICHWLDRASDLTASARHNVNVTRLCQWNWRRWTAEEAMSRRAEEPATSFCTTCLTDTPRLSLVSWCFMELAIVFWMTLTCHGMVFHVLKWDVLSHDETGSRSWTALLLPLRDGLSWDIACLQVPKLFEAEIHALTTAIPAPLAKKRLNVSGGCSFRMQKTPRPNTDSIWSRNV